MPSIRDVAARAGVSTATASRALRGLPSVVATTRARVERAAIELDYVLPFNASSLASGRTNAVGVVVPYLARWFFGTVISGAEQILREAGLDLLLYSVGDVECRTRFFSTMPMRRRVDAVLVLCLPLTPQEIDALRKLRVPVSLVGIEVDGFSSVRIDDTVGAATAVEHLIGLGHRRIGLIGDGDPERCDFTTPQHRETGYLQTLQAAGIEPDPALRVGGSFTVAGGERAMTQLLNLIVPPTAVFAMSDEMALGALRALHQRGLSVPGDVSLIGFDDHELAAALDLSTVAQPVIKQGSTAARLLLDELSGSGVPGTVTMPTHLVARASTGSVHAFALPSTS